MDRDETIAMLAGLVMSAGKGHKVDLSNPDLAICVEIIKVNVQQYANTIGRVKMILVSFIKLLSYINCMLCMLH